MTVSRRTLIKGGTIATAVTMGVPQLLKEHSVTVIVYDSRSPASRAFAALYPGQHIDIADEDPKFWQSLRSIAKRGAVKGMTGWSDFVLVRGFLQERGMRITHERLEGGCCHWTMA